MVLSLIHFHSHFHPTHFISISPVSIGFYLWISIYGEKIHFDEATLHRRRLMIYFCAIAHGTHVHGNITPLMCALCLTEGEKAAHAYIMGGGTILRLLFFFFRLTVRFICLLVENRCESFTMAALQHPFTLFVCHSSVMIYCHSDVMPSLLSVLMS